MTVIPLIVRELRATARQPFTYTLRILGVLAMLAACGAAMFEPFFATGQGGRVFGYLHFTFLCAIWILVPLLTADCLSRERREGTLPLLFLTPLKPRGIVLAKAMAHGLRAFSLWLAVLPAMSIPFLLGGVGWKEAVLSAMINFSAMVVALAVGLLASSFSTAWGTSTAASLLFGLLGGSLFVVLDGLAVIGATYRYIPPGGRTTIWRSVDVFLYTVLTLVGDFEGTWSFIFTRFAPAATLRWFAVEAGMIALSLLIALEVVWVTGWRLQKVWREEPDSRTQRIGKAMSRPVVGLRVLQRWLSWRLARNPVGWLEQRRVAGRLTPWIWSAIVVMVYLLCGLGQGLQNGDFEKVQALLGWLLLANMVVASAGSFRRERENGVLELLLVSPISEWEIIAGRLRALWSQFLPAIVIFFGGSLFQAVFSRSYEWPEILPYFALGYVTLPVIGLYFSLARKQFIASVLWTIAFGGLFPLVLAGSGELLFGTPKGFLSTAVLQGSLAGAFALILKDHLTRRRFALELGS